VFKKILVNLELTGIKKTVIKVFVNILLYVSLKKLKKILIGRKIFKIQSLEKKFTLIYSKNYWSCNESRSGIGSTLRSTRNIRFHLPKIITKFKIKKIFDAPCGDFNWMSHILKSTKVEYHGGDIVKNLIITNKKKYGNKTTKFSTLDIRIDNLYKSDLIICRDTLFHFSYKDIFYFFKNFLSSKIKFILFTSHLNSNPNFKNKDILTGDFRLIDFFAEPFNFKKNYIYTFDDRDETEIKNFKQMYLFNKLQIKNNLKYSLIFKNHIKV
jgi:hypothetical protein